MTKSLLLIVVTVVAVGVVFIVQSGPLSNQAEAQDAAVAPPVDSSPDQPPPPEPPAPGPPAPPTDQLILPHMVVDLAERRITIASEVCLQKGWLELLLCVADRMKEHESILKTQARPSDVHAALLALGLTQGKPAYWAQVDGEPIQAIPPRGPKLTIRLRWKDDDGKVHEAPSSDWLRAVAEPPVAVPEEWIFVGSDILPGDTYWADDTGELICVSNFASAVIDVPFESTADDQTLLFAAATAAIPPVGTMVEVIIMPVEGAENAEHARAMVTIDRWGRPAVEGRVVSLEQLARWAEQFVDRHARSQVIIRADGRTIGYHIGQVRDVLHIAGVWDVQETRIRLMERLLPRTAGQTAAQLAQLKEVLAEGPSILGDPRDEALAVLAQIERERQELRRLETLWQEYAMHVEAMLAETGPAPDGDEETPQP